MAVFAIRQSALEASNADQRIILKLVLPVALGADSARDLREAGAFYTDGTNTWRVFSDIRYDWRDAMNLGCLMGRLVDVNEGDTAGMTDEQIMDAARTIVQNNRVVPDFDLMPEGTDPMTYARDQQPNVPNAFRAATTVPAGFSPVEE